MSKAQVANEFFILLGVSMIMIMLFLSFIAKDMEYMVVKKEDNILRDIGFSVQNELFNAANVKDGYYREFEIPNTYRGVHYNVSINNGYMLFKSDRTNQMIEYAIPNISGELRLGINNISKVDGVIHVN